MGTSGLYDFISCIAIAKTDHQCQALGGFELVKKTGYLWSYVACGPDRAREAKETGNPAWVRNASGDWERL